MAQDLDNRNNERIFRLLQARLSSHAWSIDEARAKLKELVQAAKNGHAQLVGLDERVVLVNIETLSDILMELQQAENWGEYFATANDGSDDNADIPLKKVLGRARYTLDNSADDVAVDKNLMPGEEFEREVELLREAEVPLRKYKPPSY